MPDTATNFEQWCIVEVFGHQEYAGLVTEAEIGGCKFVRVDVPETIVPEYTYSWNWPYPKHDSKVTQPAFTKFFGQGAIYSIMPTTEESARERAAALRHRPLGTLPAKQLPAGEDSPEQSNEMPF